ncbi:MAG: IclR family transcriptional regulator [Rhodospirillales bacterium CG15_BIG_FIL_POST_REV_8_21_14_020_66_15]|nr:MAG: IclR family transcriptional regulator [Rhodospirillales bacterium CG15_BIG_FIL_POST_REV_8_21_14_020_66_15]
MTGRAEHSVQPLDNVPEITESDDRQFVTALARGLSVLRAFQPGDGVLGNGDLAERTGLPKPTVSRLTHTLTRLGYLVHAERLGKYRLGPGVLSLGYSLLANMDIRKIARPYMQELANASGLSLALGARDRLNMVYLEHARDAGSVTLRLDIGSHIPIATTAMGRAFLAAIPEDERAYLMSAMAERAGAGWPAVARGIERAVCQVAEKGFCTSFGEWQHDVNAVGVPLRSMDGATVMALNCGGPAFLHKPDRLEAEWGPRLVNVARTIEAEMRNGLAAQGSW